MSHELPVPGNMGLAGKLPRMGYTDREGEIFRRVLALGHTGRTKTYNLS